ncbi:SDR family NAD(P)-dependent oxidoreductase [Rhodococcus sp. JVH1]|uniref:SDR family NAD(P)-dependent oxidoreductase n=1 Tax=Rhodococcus sp. JVH1 TaxID=745408 RepID=UPI000271E5EB|nr:short chain dehydrogenase family protein [Rhodococcus sp. JVH1]
MSLNSASRVVVLGGTSGIGLAVAQAASEAGAAVVVASRNPNSVTAALTKLPDNAVGLAVDASSTDSLRTFFDEIGTFDHLAYTAADTLTNTPLEDYTPQKAHTFFTVRSRAPQVKRCMDPFHVIQWMTRALDRLRSRVLSRLWGFTDRDRRHLRWALLKNVENLNPAQISVRAKILKNRNSELCRGYVMKEQLQHVYSGSKKRASARLRAFEAIHFAASALMCVRRAVRSSPNSSKNRFKVLSLCPSAAHTSRPVS